MFMCVKLNSLFDSEMNVYYVTQVLKQGIKIKTMCPNYILEVRNTKSHLLQVNLAATFVAYYLCSKECNRREEGSSLRGQPYIVLSSFFC